MSRSYKHTPRCGDRKDKRRKRIANRRVRRKKLRADLPQHAGYRKLYESWHICDYETVGLSFNDYCMQEHQYAALRNLYRPEPFPDRQALKKEYRKYCIRK